MNKKTYIILSVIVGLMLVVAVVVLLLLRDSGDSQEITREEEETSTSFLETSEEGSGTSEEDSLFPQLSLPEISRLSEHQALGLTLSADGEKIYFYSQDEGDFFSMSLAGAGLEQLSQKSFYGVKDVKWSPTKDRAAISFDDTGSGERRGTYIYDLFTKEINKLPTTFSEVIFSPTGEQIAYWYADINTKTFNLSIANSDGSNFQVLSEKYIERGKIDWNATTGMIYLSEPSSDSLLTSVFRLDPNTGEVRTIIDDEMAVMASVSETGNSVFYTFTTDSNAWNISSGIVDNMGRLVGFNYLETLADKAVWDSDEDLLYVGIPDSISRSFSLVAYLNDRLTTRDRLWVYDMATTEKTLLLDPADFSEAVDIRNPVLSADEKLLFFINAINNNIYAINVEKIEETAEFVPGESDGSSADTDAGSSSGSDSGASGGRSGSGSDDGLTPEERVFNRL